VLERVICMRSAAGQAVWPPPTTIACPTVNAASSEHSHRTAARPPLPLDQPRCLLVAVGDDVSDDDARALAGKGQRSRGPMPLVARVTSATLSAKRVMVATAP
jgi:hypothetical protein